MQNAPFSHASVQNENGELRSLPDTGAQQEYQEDILEEYFLSSPGSCQLFNQPGSGDARYRSPQPGCLQKNGQVLPTPDFEACHQRHAKCQIPERSLALSESGEGPESQHLSELRTETCFPMEPFSPAMPSDCTGYLSFFGKNHLGNRRDAHTTYPHHSGECALSQVQKSSSVQGQHRFMKPNDNQQANLMVEKCPMAPYLEMCPVHLDLQEHLCDPLQERLYYLNQESLQNSQLPTMPPRDLHHHRGPQDNAWLLQELHGAQNRQVFALHDLCLLSQAYGAQQCYLSLHRNLNELYKEQEHGGYFPGASWQPPHCYPDSCANSQYGSLEKQASSDLQQHLACSTGTTCPGKDLVNTQRTRYNSCSGMLDVQVTEPLPLSESDPSSSAPGDEYHLSCSAQTACRHFENVRAPVQRRHSTLKPSQTGHISDELNPYKSLQSNNNLQLVQRVPQANLLAQTLQDEPSMTTSVNLGKFPGHTLENASLTSKPKAHPSQNAKEKSPVILTFEEAIEMFDLSLLGEEHIEKETGTSATKAEGWQSAQHPKLVKESTKTPPLPRSC
ncbi:uncharacterized protein [Ambystoma mexicanum]|uniref:uncharacterized protein n=1 Tax=Ambystoma mexicanum TaxID=8296 RepID=UPI0037E7D07E